MSKQPVSFFSNWYLVLGFGIPQLIVMMNLPTWAQLSCVTIFAWRFLIDRYGLRRPSRWIINSMAVLMVVLLRWQYPMQYSEVPFTIGLALLGALKILELREQGDLAFLTLLGLALIGVSYVFYFEIYIVLPAIAAFFFLLVGLLGNKESPLKFNWQYRQALIIFVASIPLAIFLFSVFPRSATPFNLKGKGVGSSGLTNSLNPGEISRLALSDALAMRIEIANGFISQRNSYWPAKGLDQEDDFTWTTRNPSSEFMVYEQRDENGKLAPSQQVEIPYRVTLEPSEVSYVPSHRQTVRLMGEQIQISITKDGFYKAAVGNISERSIYSAVLNFRKKSGPQDSSPYLQVSNKVTPKIKSLANTIVGKSSTVDEKIESLKKYFEENGYSYTLEPGNNSNTLEEFLLKGKVGFCEHFAAAGATLLRLMNIPSRVILGYQGGTRNSFGEFIRVAQRDAHAWIEYVDQNGNWKILDLVNVVAPLRIELGAEAFQGLPANIAALKDISKFNGQIFSKMNTYFGYVGLFVDNLNYKWSIFLIEFDIDKQRELLAAMGIPVGILFVVTLLLGIGISYLLIRLTKKRVALSDGQKLFNEMIELSQGYGVSRFETEGPEHFVNRFSKRLPQYQNVIADIGELYLRDRYSLHKPSREEIKKAKSQLLQIPIDRRG